MATLVAESAVYDCLVYHCFVHTKCAVLVYVLTDFLSMHKSVICGCLLTQRVTMPSIFSIDSLLVDDVV